MLERCDTTLVDLKVIELDVSIQCRAALDGDVVAEYAEAMEAGAEFPPVQLFGTDARCWIGDGWHRVAAAKQIGALEIRRTCMPGAVLMH